ncbi:hypothetical protein [Streptomyces gibsoniae]|uniref:Uncharacterized protein n=1 Tax=Streptomyces gibsoniae TaxID=3075529 RepID=A0ABU2TX29_9ACTN|nr:hypothetical protein [Streptomyces sp. DSM 41699]MDT0465445.1 hypothetical protein [Streptomyces sp. DSM 41699]
MATPHLMDGYARDRSDGGPVGWKPTNQAFWCTYAMDYTHIKSLWKPTTTDAEKTAPPSMPNACTN